MDRFSPIAPACVRVLLLPVHHIERSTFTRLVKTLQEGASAIKLRDLANRAQDDALLLSPLRFQDGSILYNFCVSETQEQSRQLSPFELWRETLLVIGVADGLSDDDKRREEQIRAATSEVHDKYGRVVYRHVLALHQGESIPDVSYVDIASSASIVSAVQQITIRFLEEFSTYAAAMQASPGIQTPGNTAQGILRSTMLREEDSRPSSRQSGTAEPRSPSGEESMSRPTSQDVMPPATTFDQIPAANALARSESAAGRRSKSHQRTSSFDRVPVLSKEKLKDRGKARVGIVSASIYLMAGQWAEALKILVESTTRLRSLNDHIWNGKGLELIAVCLLLHLWSGIDVQIPAIIFQLTDKIRDRLSKSFAADLAQKLTSPLSPIEKLSSSLHDLLRHILVLYHAIEGTLELPYLAVAEARIRFCKILASLQSTNGILNQQSISWIVDRRVHSTSPAIWSASPFSPSKPLTRQGIADMLARALPTSDEHVSLTDHISILSGVASVYAMLKLERKKAITLKALVSRLTAALNQARKVGAAEMGIHPSATLVIDQGSHTLLDEIEGSKGLSNLAQELASVYGVHMDPDDQRRSFGSRALQLDILRELLKLCEASPDLQGITKLVIAFMTAAKPEGAVDVATKARSLTVRADEQAHMVAMFNKASWLSKQLGIVSPQSRYWDSFMLRGIQIVPTAPEQSLIRTSVTRPSTREAANPLLYDPNAPTMKQGPTKTILTVGETAAVYVQLQNQFDIALDIEYVKLITDGMELACSHGDIRLAASCMQRVPLEICPAQAGEASITGCLIKVAGCAEQTFNLTTKPWRSAELLTIKEIGQDAGRDSSMPSTTIEHDKVEIEIVKRQPQLIVEQVEVIQQMMLEGEIQKQKISVKNISGTAATVLSTICLTRNLQAVAEPDGSIEPGQTYEQIFEITADPATPVVQASMTYAVSADSKYARTCLLTIKTSVRSALQVVNVSVQDTGNDGVRVFVDLCNLWKTPLAVDCAFVTESSQQMVLQAGQTSRTYLDVARSTLPTTQDEFLKALKINYSTEAANQSRNGRALLHHVQLSEQSLSTIKRAAAEISLSLVSASEKTTVGSFINVRAVVKNTTSASITPTVLQLRQFDQLDSTRTLSFAGATSRILSVIPAHDQISVDFSLYTLLLGKVKLDATLRPALQSEVEVQIDHRTTKRLELNVIE